MQTIKRDNINGNTMRKTFIGCNPVSAVARFDEERVTCELWKDMEEVIKPSRLRISMHYL